MLTADALVTFEQKMKNERGWSRAALCNNLGVSQPTWRKMLESEPTSTNNATLALAMAALAANLEPYGEPQ